MEITSQRWDLAFALGSVSPLEVQINQKFLPKMSINSAMILVGSLEKMLFRSPDEMPRSQDPPKDSTRGVYDPVNYFVVCMWMKPQVGAQRVRTSHARAREVRLDSKTLSRWQWTPLLVRAPAYWGMSFHFQRAR